MRVSLPPTIRSSIDDPQTPGAGKSLARKTAPGSPELCVGCGCGGLFGVGFTGGDASFGQQTCK